MPVDHLVVLMLENRSFDSMLGRLYPGRPDFDGLPADAANSRHGQTLPVKAWNDDTQTAATLAIPDPDPGESFDDIRMQIHGRADGGGPADGPPTMGGFVDNYAGLNPQAPDAVVAGVMHCVTPEQVPVLSTLARAFGVSDRWHAPAPCQTWPNRFFAHTGTAGGYVNNAPTHFPYRMTTVFDRLESVGQTWRIYFHDIPQTATLARLWDKTFGFREFTEHFVADVTNGDLPAYTFIEPRYFTDTPLGLLPNDQHPPHPLVHGEALIATVYNALRASALWPRTLLVVTYDEHGGCYDHVAPPAAVSPDGLQPDGFAFDRFGVRVPAVLASPFIAPGTVLRPKGGTPFDHTSIIATLRARWGFAPLTARDAAAPDLMSLLGAAPDNVGPSTLDVPQAATPAAAVAQVAASPPNDLQRALAAAAQHLPTIDADLAAHIRRLVAVPDVVPAHETLADAAAAVAAHIRAFLGLG